MDDTIAIDGARNLPQAYRGYPLALPLNLFERI